MSDETRTVLILDDDDAVRESLVDFFEDCGWCVLSAANAEDAIELAARESPDGAVVDVRLPGIDGNEFLRIATKAHPTLACVLITGSPEYRPPKDVATLPQLFQKVFIKPIHDLNALDKALRNQVEKYRGK